LFVRWNDIRLGLRVPTTAASYVYTHRYLVHLIDYWNHFVQLHELLDNARKVQRGEPVSAPRGSTVYGQAAALHGHGCRVLLDLDIVPMTSSSSALCVAVPMCSASDRALLLDVHRLTMSTRFASTTDIGDMLKEMCVVIDGTSSSIPSERREIADSSPHCFVELQDIALKSVALYHGHRVDDDQSWMCRGAFSHAVAMPTDRRTGRRLQDVRLRQDEHESARRRAPQRRPHHDAQP